MPPSETAPDVVESARWIARVLEANGMPYAIGGALALAQHGFVRATKDVDVNVFVPAEQIQSLLGTLERAGLSIERDAGKKALDEGWFSAWQGSVRIDLFVPSIDFSWEALKSRQRLPLLGEQFWFLAPEALCVFKLLFFRTKDLADLERLVQSPSPLDRAAVRSAIAGMMGEDDERVRAWDDIVRRFGRTD
ncbi:MAG: nucleotidyltransferase [Myxococcota bacterium]